MGKREARLMFTTRQGNILSLLDLMGLEPAVQAHDMLAIIVMARKESHGASNVAHGN